jgi:hypothetical protein
VLNLELVAPGFRSTLGVKFHAEITVDGEVPVGPARRGGMRDDTVRVVVAKARICMAVVARSGRYVRLCSTSGISFGLFVAK